MPVSAFQEGPQTHPATDSTQHIIIFATEIEKYQTFLPPKETPVIVPEDHNFLQATSGNFEWETFLHGFLTLPTTLYWQIIIIISIITNFFLVTFTYIFYEQFIVIVFHKVYFLDFIYAIDFSLALLYARSDSLRFKMKVEVRSYLALVVDGISLLPLEAIFYNIFENVSNKILFWLKSIAFLRFYRLFVFFTNEEDNAGENHRTLFVFKYIVYLSILLHSSACIWYTFACTDRGQCSDVSSWAAVVESYTWHPDTPLDWYLLSAYFSLSTIANIGFGDTHATTSQERILSIFVMLLGFALTIGIYIGSLTSQFVNFEHRRATYVDCLYNIKNHLTRLNFDTQYTKKVLQYYDVLWKKKNGIKEPSNFELLPRPLRMEICYDINSGLFDCSLLFVNLEQPFLRSLSLKMKNEFYLPGDIIYYQNKVKHSVIFIVSGVVEILSYEDDESPILSLTAGTCLGEISTAFPCPAKVTARAATYTELQVLHKVDLLHLVVDYPLIHKKIYQDIEERIKLAYSRSIYVYRSNLEDALLAHYLKEQQSMKQFKRSLRAAQNTLKTENELETDDGKHNNDVTSKFLYLYNISEKVFQRERGICWSNTFPFILQPNNIFSEVWMHFVFLVVLYVCFVYPYCSGFIRTYPQWTQNLGALVDTVYILDIFITCSTAIEHRNSVDTNFKTIWWQHMDTLGFYMDVFSVLPIEIYAFTKENKEDYDRLWAVLKLNRLLKAWKLSQYLRKLEENIWANMSFIRSFEYVLYLLLMSYWGGVLLYMEACYTETCNERSWLAAHLRHEIKHRDVSPCTKFPYTMAVYFSVMTFSGVGFGDIYPRNQVEIIFVMLVIITGILLLGYCIAKLSSTFTHNNLPFVEYQEAIIAIHQFMHDNRTSQSIVNRVNNYFHLQWLYNKGSLLRQKKPLLAAANQKLQQEVLMKEWLATLLKVPLFQNTDLDFVQLVIAGSRVLLLPPNEIITYAGSISREMYVIQKGYCQVFDGRTGRIQCQIGPGSHCGDIEMLFGVPNILTVCTITNCKVINISYAVYSQAISTFPNIMKEINDVIAESSDFYKGLKFDLKQHFSFEEKETIVLRKEHFLDFHYYYQKHSKHFSKAFRSILKTCRKSDTAEYISPFKALGKLSFIRYLLLPCTINPTGYLVKLWCIYRLLTSLIISLLNPYYQCIHPYGIGVGHMLHILNICTYVDIYVNLHIGYFNREGLLVMHPLMTAIHYLRNSFIIDLLACFPFEIFAPLFSSEFTYIDNTDYFNKLCMKNAIRCILHLNRVLQIYRLIGAFNYLQDFVLIRSDIIHVIKFIPLTLVFTNMWVCMLVTMHCYYFTESISGPLSVQPNTMVCSNGSWLKQSQFQHLSHPTDIYLVAFYWVESTILGSGFGDLTAQSKEEMITCIIMVILGTLLCGYMFSTIASNKARLYSTLSQYQDMVTELSTFMKHEKVDTNLQKRLISHFEYDWKQTQGIEPHVIFSNFPSSLMEDAMMQMYEKTLKEVPLFKHVDYSFYRVMGKHLRHIYILCGETVVRCNDVQSDIFIIHRGKVEVLSTLNEITCMGSGGLFGNIGSSAAGICSITIIARTDLVLLAISSEIFYSLLKSYPSIKTEMDYLLNDFNYYIPSTAFEDVTESSFPLNHGRSLSCQHSSSTKRTESNVSKDACSSGNITPTHPSATETVVTTLDMTCTGFVMWRMVLPRNWFRCAILPESLIFTVISYLIPPFSCLNCVLISYSFAFQDHSYSIIFVILGIDVFFYIRIFLKLHKAYINKFGEYVMDTAKIYSRYSKRKKQIILDIMANAPVEVVAIFFSKYRMQIVSCCRMLRLLRIIYLYGFYKAHFKLLNANKLSLQLSSLIIWVTLLIHAMACIWFFLACPFGNLVHHSWAEKVGVKENDPLNSYVLSVYYIISHFTTTGYGDVLPYRCHEVVTVIVMMVVIKFSIALFIGSLTAVLSSFTSTLTSYEYCITELRDSLQNQNVSPHQMDKMWNYARQLWKQERGTQMPRLLLKAPPVLRCDLMNAIYGHHLRNSYMFSNTNEDFLRQLTVLLERFVFFTGNYIVQHGDTDMNMYFIHRGEVDVLTVHPNLTETVHDVLKANDMFGIAQGMFHGLPHHFSFRAKTVVDIVVLHLEKWEHLLKYFPAEKEEIYQRADNMYYNV